jgi:hypothetical protein
MTNPFEQIDARLSNMESILLDLKHSQAKELAKETPSSIDKDTLHTVPETEKILKTSRVSLDKWVKAGLLKKTRVNTRVRYRQSDIDNFLNNHKKGREN